MKKQTTAICPLLAALLITSPSSQAEDLNDIYQMALQSDPVLGIEKSSYEIAIESKNQARSLYLPSVNFSASKTETDQEIISSSNNPSSVGETSYGTTTYGLSLRQPLYRGDYIAQLKQAKANTRAAEAQLNSVQQNLIIRTAEAYFNALAAQDNLEFAQAEKNAIARQLEQTKQRFEVGLIAITDVHESQAAYDLANASEIVAQNELATSHQAVQELTGQLPTELAVLSEDMQLISPEPADIDAWVSKALDQNFTIIAAEANVEAAREVVSLRRSGHYPTLDLFANFQNTDTEGGFFGAREDETTTVGIELNVPLYSGGGTSAGVRQGVAQLTQSKEGLEQQRRAIQREVRDAYLGVLASISRVKALNQAVTSNKSALQATEAGYEVGTRTTVDVLNSRRELYRAQRDYSRSRYDYILASLRLKNGIGVLQQADIEEINQWLGPVNTN